MSPRRDHSWRSTPAEGRRLAVRFVTLFLILALGLYFSFRLSRQPTFLDALTLAEAAKPVGPRRAPFPDPEILKHAADQAPFLVENEELLLPNRKNERNRLDADARYHLLLLAATTPTELLRADAMPGPPFGQLQKQPAAHRGELMRYEGELLAAGPLELKRDAVAGLSRCFQAVIAGDGPADRLLVLFAEWPAGWPDLKESNRSAPQVVAAGYFLKIAQLPSPREGGPPLFVPVLVARSLEAAPPAASPLAALPWVYAAMAAPVLFLLACGWLLFKRGDQQLQARLAAAQARQAEEEAKGLAKFEAVGASVPEGVSLAAPKE